MMHNPRFDAAIQTLYMMLIHERWYEAKQIVRYEMDWHNDPPPPGINGGWERVYAVLVNVCGARDDRLRR